MAGWQAYVQSAQALGFHRITIIDRKSYQPVGYSAQTDIATAWQDGDKQINENQELLDDWKDNKKATFCFYGKKFNIVTRDGDDGTYIVCSKGKEIILARQFNTVWFVCYSDIAFNKEDDEYKKDQYKNWVKAPFNNARKAFASIGKVWDQLEEAGV